MRGRRRHGKALTRYGSPEAITTDGLRSYRAAMKELGNTEKQEVGRRANNRNVLHPERKRQHVATEIVDDVGTVIGIGE